MAARPKSVEALTAAREAITKVVQRLHDVVTKSESVLQTNPHLDTYEQAMFKSCARVARKQLTVLSKLDSIALPTAVPSATISAAPTKKLGRPKATAVAATAIVAEPPKRRGRPPKAKTENTVKAEALVVPAEQPKRRGRPPKARVEETVQAIEAQLVLAEGEVAPRRRGRPKGSKNKPKVLNGATDISVN